MSHAKIFAPSAFARMDQCPYSARYGNVASYDNADSAKGTQAHRLAQKMAVDGWADAKDEAMAIWRTEVDRVLSTVSDQAVVRIEEQQHYPYIHSRCKGTCDLCVTDPVTKTITILDFKNGVGIEVFPEDSLQMLVYGEGEFTNFSKMYDFAPEHVELIIVQPNSFRFQPVRRYAGFVQDHDSIRRRISSVIERVTQRDPYTQTGPECRYCQGLPFCPAIHADIEGTLADAPEPEMLEEPTPETLARLAGVMEKLKLIAVAEKNLKDFLHGYMIQDQKSVPGLKVVAGKGSRSWKDPDSMCGVVGDPYLYEKKMRTPAGLEKHMGKEKFKTLNLNDRILKTSGSPFVVLETDKRPSLDLQTEIMEMFKKGENKND